MDSEKIEDEQQAIAELETNDLSDSRRRALLSALRQIGTERSIGVVRANLQAADTRTQVGAVFALAHIGTEEAIDALIDCLEMGTGPRFTFAVKSLAGLRSPHIVPALIRTLEGHRGEFNEGDKQLIVFALVQTPHRSEVPVLSAILHEGSRRTRRMAAIALTQIRAPESREALEGAVESLSWLRGISVRRALRLQQNVTGE